MTIQCGTLSQRLNAQHYEQYADRIERKEDSKIHSLLNQHIPSKPFPISLENGEALRASQEVKKRISNFTLSAIDAEIEKYQTRIEKVYEDYLRAKIP